jgi:hypothetical protein
VMKLDNMPKPTELMDNPQLAILVSLDTTLVAAMRALLAVHTDILDGTFPRTTTEADYWADRLIHLACQTEKALRKYRAAIDENLSPGNEDF